MGFEQEKVGTTRTVDIEYNTYLCYRYRINLGDNIGESDLLLLNLKFHQMRAERNVILEISKAKCFISPKMVQCMRQN